VGVTGRVWFLKFYFAITEPGRCLCIYYYYIIQTAKVIVIDACPIAVEKTLPFILLGHPYFLTFDRLLELHASFFFLTRNTHSLLDNVVKNL
jgi:hypothetical protein